MKSARFCVLLILLLLFVAASAWSGVGQGNPKFRQIFNTRFGFELGYSIDDFSMSLSSSETLRLTGQVDPRSTIEVRAKASEILLPDQLREAEKLAGCEPTELGRYMGFRCPERLVLLNPGRAVIAIQASTDRLAKKVLDSFHAIRADRLPPRTALAVRYEEEGWTAAIGLIDHDQRLVLRSDQRLSVRTVEDMTLWAELPDSAHLEDCALSPDKKRILCRHDDHVLLWDLDKLQLVWNYAAGFDVGAAYFLPHDPSDSILIQNRYTQEIVRISALDGAAHELPGLPHLDLADVLDVNDTTILHFWDAAAGASVLVDLGNGKVLRTLAATPYVLSVAGEEKVVVVRSQYGSGNSAGLDEVSKLNPKTGVKDWTVYVSSDQNSYKVGPNFVAVTGLDGIIHLYDLQSGSQRPEVMDYFPVPYNVIGNGAFETFLSEDGSRIFRKGPADFTTWELGATDQVAKLEENGESLGLWAPGPGLLASAAKTADGCELSVYSGIKPRLISRIGLSWLECVRHPWVSQDARFVYVVGDQTVTGYELPSGKRIFKIDETFNSASLIGTTNGERAYLASEDNLFLIDPKTQSYHLLLHVDDGWYGEDLHDPSLSPDEHYLSVAGRSQYYVIDLATAQVVFRGELLDPETPGSRCRINRTEFRAADRLLVFSSCGVVLRNPKTPTDLQRYPVSEDARLSQDLKLALEISYLGGKSIVKESITGKTLQEAWGHADPNPPGPLGGYPGGYRGATSGVFLGPDQIVTGGEDGTLRVWRLR